MPDLDPGESLLKLVYVGRRLTTSNVLRPAYADLKPGHPLVTYGKMLIRAEVGSIIVLTTTSNGEKHWATGPKAPRYEGQYPDNNQILDWRAKEIADVTRHGMLRTAKSVADPIQVALDPIRDLMRSQVTNDARAAVLAYITAYISK